MRPFIYLTHRARGLWVSMTSSLWFIPSAMVLGSVGVALILVEISARTNGEALARFPRLFGAGAAGSRGMLSTIAGSVITVAGVTFSITIAALALASAQYTPRVLRTFMADRANQVVLGTFVGVYCYCLVVLRTIRGGDEGAFVPSIAVLGGFVLALVSVGVLIFFIHHIAAALQASTILERVRRATEATLVELFPDSAAIDDDDDARALETLARLDLAWTDVPSMRTGYVQSVDLDGLLSFAREHAVVVRMERAIGDFITAGAPLVSVAPVMGSLPDRRSGVPATDAVTESVGSLFTIDAYRTVEQDAAFGVLQIVDIALKALSPGINDTTTAVTCVDHLGALLACAAGRRIGPRTHEAPHGVMVLTAGPTFAGLVAVAFDDIRRNASGNVPVLGRLFAAIETVAHFTANPRRRRVLLEHIDLLAEVCARGVAAPTDQQRLADRARSARARLALMSQTVTTR